MSGKAMFTIVTSRNPMNTATAVTSRTFQRRRTPLALLAEDHAGAGAMRDELARAGGEQAALRCRDLRPGVEHGALAEHPPGVDRHRAHECHVEIDRGVARPRVEGGLHRAAHR